jgi:hypothetical protein
MFKYFLLALAPLFAFSQESTCLVERGQRFGNSQVGTKFTAMPYFVESEKPKSSLHLSRIEICQSPSSGTLLGIRYGVDQVNRTSDVVTTTAQIDPIGLVPNGIT